MYRLESGDLVATLPIFVASIQVLNADKYPEDEDDDEDVSIIRYVHAMLESFALVPFTQILGKTMQDCMQMVQAAQAELRTPDADIYFEMSVQRNVLSRMDTDIRAESWSAVADR